MTNEEREAAAASRSEARVALREKISRLEREHDEALEQLAAVHEKTIDALLDIIDAERKKVAEVTRERDALAARLDAIGDNGPGSKRAAWVAEWQRAQLAEAERDALAAQLAALREAAARYRHSLGWDEEAHPILGRVPVSRRDEEVDDALDRALTDTAPAVEAYKKRVQSEVVAERDAALRLIEAYGIAGREERGPNIGDVYERPDGGTMTVVDVKRGSWRMPVFESEKGTVHERAIHPSWVIRGGR